VECEKIYHWKRNSAIPFAFSPTEKKDGPDKGRREKGYARFSSLFFNREGTGDLPFIAHTYGSREEGGGGGRERLPSHLARVTGFRSSHLLVSRKAF